MEPVYPTVHDNNGPMPNIYEFPPFHTTYAGLLHHILKDGNTAAIKDDYGYWNENGRASTAAKLLLIDHGGSLAETKVQHVFFDGDIWIIASTQWMRVMSPQGSLCLSMT